MTMGGREAAGGKILRCAQNDRGEARNDNGGGKWREKRFFAALRMTKEECCHSEERISSSLSF